MKTLTQLRNELRRLECIDFEPRIMNLRNQIRQERLPQKVKILQAMAALRGEPKVTKRWPDDVPLNVLKSCEAYWSGTTEFTKFRIHCWNYALVCTSYPGAAYWTNGGKNYGGASFHFISLKEMENGGRVKPKVIGEWLEGRQSKKALIFELNTRTQSYRPT